MGLLKELISFIMCSYPYAVNNTFGICVWTNNHCFWMSASFYPDKQIPGISRHLEYGNKSVINGLYDGIY